MTALGIQRAAKPFRRNAAIAKPEVARPLPDRTFGNRSVVLVTDLVFMAKATPIFSKSYRVLTRTVFVRQCVLRRQQNYGQARYDTCHEINKLLSA